MAVHLASAHAAKLPDGSPFMANPHATIGLELTISEGFTLIDSMTEALNVLRPLTEHEDDAVRMAARKGFDALIARQDVIFRAIEREKHRQYAEACR